MLNQRFNKLVSSFLSAKQHQIHLTRCVTWHQVTFMIDHVLPYGTDNQQLKSLELDHADLFIKFLDNANRIHTNYLTKIVVRPFIDVYFDPMIKFLSECPQLNEIKLNVMTNLDSSWANGRKWTRWFETMQKTNRHNTLKMIDICVWCINTTDVANFDPRIWGTEGVYQLNSSWKIQLKPDQALNWSQSRRSVEFSRTEQDYLTLIHTKQKSTCILS